VTWATSVPILVFLGLSVLELGPMYETDRRQTDRRQTKPSLNASAPIMRMHNNGERLMLSIGRRVQKKLLNGLNSFDGRSRTMQKRVKDLASSPIHQLTVPCVRRSTLGFAGALLL